MLIFSAMVVGGLAAGNPGERIILRALAGLPLGFMLGALVGWIGLQVVRDQLDRSMGDDAASSDTTNEPGTTTAGAQPQ